MNFTVRHGDKYLCDDGGCVEDGRKLLMTLNDKAHLEMAELFEKGEENEEENYRGRRRCGRTDGGRTRGRTGT